MDRKLLISSVLKLSEVDYVGFMQTVHMDYPLRSRELTNKITNYWKGQENKIVKQNSRTCSGIPTKLPGSEVPSSGPGSKLESSLQKPSSSLGLPKNTARSDSASGRKPETSSPLPWQKSAWKTGFIFRGDKVPEKGQVFMDVEKVTIRKRPGAKSHEQKAATVSLVNADGKVILWAFIKRNDDDICQYAPRMTNLNRTKLEVGVNLEVVHMCLKISLAGNQLVGVAVSNDLKSLDWKHDNILDLQHHFQDSNGQGFGLGHVVQKLLSNRSGFQVGHHYAIDDARMTLAAYKKLVELQNTHGALQKANEKLANSRKEYNQSKPKMSSEKCSCK